MKRHEQSQTRVQLLRKAAEESSSVSFKVLVSSAETCCYPHLLYESVDNRQLSARSKEKHDFLCL